MTQHFNGLTPAEAERLAMLAEECAEVIQIVGKILRHGYESFHPKDRGTTNAFLLADELNDLRGVITVMIEKGDVDMSPHNVEQAIAKKLLYAHHQ